jgi:2-dehydro-3-deoxygalactonokinase
MASMLMSPATLVAGDWGTSHLRLFLCQVDGTVIDRLDGPGAASVHGDFPGVLDALLAGWTRQYGALPVVLCGMVGSSLGWILAPYAECPASAERIAQACVELHGGRVHIVPGLSCRNRLNAPDVLRGEETQILGALHLNASLRSGSHLLCLPGTHTKWALLEDGSVREFLTAPTGELFALLCRHSILVSDQHLQLDLHAVADGPDFEHGLMQVRRFPTASLLHRLFECRSRRLTADLAPEDAMPLLSGMLIASDVQGAVRLFGAPGVRTTVQLIGTPRLTELYARALVSQDCDANVIDGSLASLNGLLQVHRLRSQPRAVA